MKKLIKPFWSFNIIEIESWLSDMAKQGYILEDINLITKVFTFKEGVKKDLTYKIDCLSRGKRNNLSTLKNNGWNEIISKGRWVFLCNENNKENIKINPSRENLVKRNNLIKGIFIAMLFYCGIFIGPVSIILGGIVLGGLGLIEVEGTPPIDVHIQQVIFLVFIAFLIYIIIKLNNINKELLNEGLDDKEINKNKESLVKRKDLIKKVKFGWFYSPDKTQEWLEDMESKGYNLYKVNKMGSTFYFKKDKPRKVRYIADYQNKTTSLYYEIHKQDGWKLVYDSFGSITHWSIWSKEYEDECPQIYTNDFDIKNHAKKVLITHTIMFVPTIIIYTYIIMTDIYYISVWNNTNITSLLIFSIVLIEFTVFYIKIVGYYSRTKKRIQE